MAKKQSPWMAHMASVRRKYPNLGFIEVAKKAKETYKKQTGGTALGGDLSPSDFQADPNFPTSGGAALQVEATQYSGGAKKSRKSKAKSHKKSHKKAKSRKSKSHKRR